MRRLASPSTGRGGIAVGCLIALGGAVLALAPHVGIERWHVVAAALPARGALTTAAVVVLLLTGLVALHRRWRPVALPVAAGFAVVVGLNAPVLLARGITTEPVAAPADGQLRLLAWNTNGGLVSAAVVARLAAEQRADVVVLPQRSHREGSTGYRDAFDAAGHPMVDVGAPGEQVQVAVWVSPAHAPAYPWAVPGPDPDKTVELPSNDPALPTLVALHAPWPAGHQLAGWERDLDWVARLCATAAPVVVVGDLNASVDDLGGPRLGRCEDAASLRDGAGAGTWPTRLPLPLAMPIDHVMLTPAAGQVVSFTVLTAEDGSGARHRPTMTVIRPPR